MCTTAIVGAISGGFIASWGLAPLIFAAWAAGPVGILAAVILFLTGGGFNGSLIVAAVYSFCQEVTDRSLCKKPKRSPTLLSLEAMLGRRSKQFIVSRKDAYEEHTISSVLCQCSFSFEHRITLSLFSQSRASSPSSNTHIMLVCSLSRDCVLSPPSAQTPKMTRMCAHVMKLVVSRYVVVRSIVSPTNTHCCPVPGSK